MLGELDNIAINLSEAMREDGHVEYDSASDMKNVKRVLFWREYQSSKLVFKAL